MKFICFALGAIALPMNLGQIVKHGVGEVEQLASSSLLNSNLRRVPVIQGNEGISPVAAAKKRFRPPPMLQIPSKSIKPEPEYPSWVVTLAQKKVFDERKAKGLDVESLEAIKDIKQKALLSQMESTMAEREERANLRADFDKAISRHSSAVAERKAIENTIQGKSKPDEALLKAYMKALKDEFDAQEELENQRLLSYPKSLANVMKAD